MQSDYSGLLDDRSRKTRTEKPVAIVLAAKSMPELLFIVR